MSWHVKAQYGWGRQDTEAIDNAKEIYSVLSARGWTKNAVAGILGNMDQESGYNPWRWQGDRVQSTGNSPWTSIGYGLFQFTPAGKYINTAQSLTGYGPNFSNQTGQTTDGIAQLIYMDTTEGYYATSSHPLSFAQYKSSTESGAYLAETWLYNYERPADPSATISERRSAGDYWVSVLSGETPSEPGPDEPGPDEPGPNKPTPTPVKKILLYGGARDMIRRMILHS